jgi:hypothetical protein
MPNLITLNKSKILEAHQAFIDQSQTNNLSQAKTKQTNQLNETRLCSFWTEPPAHQEESSKMLTIIEK